VWGVIGSTSACATPRRCAFGLFKLTNPKRGSAGQTYGPSVVVPSAAAVQSRGSTSARAGLGGRVHEGMAQRLNY
jgi:hypothetical protein